MTRGLTKAGIVEAGLSVLDEAGLEGLTVRAVAARLGVQAPALYWHVRDKQQLIDEMATQMWRDIMTDMTGLPAGLPWQQSLRSFAVATRRTLLSHRDGAKVFSGTYLADPEVLRAQEQQFAYMAGQGFSVRDTIRASALIYNFTIGFCIEEQSVAQARAAGDERYSLERRAERIGTQAPLVLESGPELFGDPDARFTDLINVLLDAAARLPDSPPD